MTAVREQTGSAIRPFHVDVPEEALTELRRRWLIGAARRVGGRFNVDVEYV